MSTLVEPLDTAFVVLEGQQGEASKIADFESNEMLREKEFKVTLAPSVKDILWENMMHSSRLQWRALIVYPLLLVGRYNDEFAFCMD